MGLEELGVARDDFVAVSNDADAMPRDFFVIDKIRFVNARAVRLEDGLGDGMALRSKCPKLAMQLI